MHEFNSTLLREKFLIKEVSNKTLQQNDGGVPDVVTAMSNRMVLPFRDEKGRIVEEFVIRTHSMHCCVRMAGELIVDHFENGPISSRLDSFDWEDMWSRVMTDVHREFDPNFWCVIYLNGNVVFHDKRHHVFFDVIEKFSHKFNFEYEQSVDEAEKAFMRAGKKVDISHENQIASIIDVRQDRTKCGIIMRSPKKTTTCNIRVEDRFAANDHILPAFKLCAAYHEGIHHGFTI